MPDNDSLRRAMGPAVASFDAQVEAEDAGILYTPDQWSSARGSRRSASTSLRAKGSVPPPSFSEPVTVRMTQEQLRVLIEECRRAK
jgi:hypothetical protein